MEKEDRQPQRGRALPKSVLERAQDLESRYLIFVSKPAPN